MDTACIDINVRSHKVESAIFVQGKTYAKNGIKFAQNNQADIIKWIEVETGLKYGKQYHNRGTGKMYNVS